MEWGNEAPFVPTANDVIEPDALICPLHSDKLTGKAKRFVQITDHLLQENQAIG